jgi:hypothetical protein
MIFSHPITRWVTVQANCHNLKGRIIVFLLTRFLASPIEIANRQRETFKTAMKAANPLSERGGSFVAVLFFLLCYSRLRMPQSFCLKKTSLPYNICRYDAARLKKFRFFFIFHSKQ